MAHSGQGESMGESAFGSYSLNSGTDEEGAEAGCLEMVLRFRILC